MARRGTCGRGASEGASGPLPFGRHGLLAGQRARRKCQEQRSGLGRAHYRVIKSSGGGYNSSRSCGSVRSPFPASTSGASWRARGKSTPCFWCGAAEMT
jgi:hypothetical protein